MGLNNGYLKSNRTSDGDELYTPLYAVKPLLKYIDNDKIIWCPFDLKDSAFVRLLKENGNKVYHTHIAMFEDFLTYEPKFEYDYIISNPPYSIKDQVLKRLYELKKPYAMLLPIQTIQGIKRFPYIKEDLQILSFDKRIGYHTNKYCKPQKANSFASAYFCKGILPKNLILEYLEKDEETLL